ncbi:class I SAM-dependent methyltransferase [Helicobacter marmotae]|uniref:class I SAM-dependent methyltransferase n=1 Tax=Helicobacter marmotae TaxID=152490 RepID=UPI000CF0BEAC|nr:class I SAM-dependent methyltransferase [Helicobacter marmotae]
MPDMYLESMRADKALAQAYFSKSIHKSEQQKALESLLTQAIEDKVLSKNAPYKIADLACGGGTLSYHLASFFPNATFSLLDYNTDGLDLAKAINAPFSERMEFILGDLRELPFLDNSFDLVFCWQALSWVAKEDIAKIFTQITRVLKPKGRLFASSLFNTEFDVDLYTSICDRTRPSHLEPGTKKARINGYYNTYCTQSIKEMLQGKVSSFEILPFSPNIDLKKDPKNRGIGTFTLSVSDSPLLKEHSVLLPHCTDLENLRGISQTLAHPSNSLKATQAGKQSLEYYEQEPLEGENKHIQGQTRESDPTCHHEGRRSGGEELLLSTKDSLEESPEILQVCHSEGARSATEESLSNLLESPQRFFGAEAPQNDNKSNPQDKTTLQGKLVCHSEGGRSPTEESLPKSLVAKRDSSPLAGVQNDNNSQTSSSSEVYLHTNTQSPENMLGGGGAV